MTSQKVYFVGIFIFLDTVQTSSTSSATNRTVGKAAMLGVLPSDLGFLMFVLGSGFFRQRTGVFRVKLDYIGKNRVIPATL